jgi:DNA-binding response OmpR family regulator
MASPLAGKALVVLFGHDPNVVENRCEALHSGGYETVIATTASDTEEQIASGRADALLVGSQTGPLTRLRLAEKARQHGVAVVHIAYPNHPEPSEDEVYVTRPLGAKELLDAMSRAMAAHAQASRRNLGNAA